MGLGLPVALGVRSEDGDVPEVSFPVRKSKPLVKNYLWAKLYRLGRGGVVYLGLLKDLGR